MCVDTLTVSWRPRQDLLRQPFKEDVQKKSKIPIYPLKAAYEIQVIIFYIFLILRLAEFLLLYMGISI